MTDATPARVQAAGWGWRYAGRKRPALSDVSFAIEPGERVLLLGASGAGKSTMLAGLAGVLGVLLGTRMDGENQIAVELSILIGAVAVATVLAWRWPRVSGVALGAAAPLIAVTLMWGIVVGAEGVAP